ncbi:hypothetical protein [Allosalinactinospora lopnorensis]|uniref:hypothetical protein n=1 Tax=Allosalinactinospora lopnorensis TaxID=1352348 RepID=UPI0012E0DA67|nr:hypothetical protein [Allosalinactinospora lopnorensis]
MKRSHLVILVVGAVLLALPALPLLSVATAWFAVPEFRSADGPALEPEGAPPEARAEREDRAPAVPGRPGQRGVDISEFNGLSGDDGAFGIRVEEAYIDGDGTVNGGHGLRKSAPDDMDYAVFSIEITNTSGAPAAWEGYEQVATGSSGQMYVNDTGAESAVAGDYVRGDTLVPGASATTEAIFAIPPQESLAEVELASGAGSDPVVLDP